MWFIAETNQWRRLKVVFIKHRNGDIVIKSAYEPDEIEEEIYEKKLNKPEASAVLDDDSELWESKQLGASAEYTRRAPANTSKEVDDSLGLQAISIRLQKELVDQLKDLAKQDGIGYQPYIRQLLTRHVRDTLAKKDERK